MGLIYRNKRKQIKKSDHKQLKIMKMKNMRLKVNQEIIKIKLDNILVRVMELKLNQ